MATGGWSIAENSHLDARGGGREHTGNGVLRVLQKTLTQKTPETRIAANRKRFIVPVRLRVPQHAGKTYRAHKTLTFYVHFGREV